MRTNAFTLRAFTHKSFYTEKWFHRELLHTDAFAHRSVYTEKPLHRSFLLHTDAVTQRSLYTETAWTHRRVYRQKLLHKEAFTERAFTHGSFHTQKFLHREAFRQRSFYTQARLHTEVFTQRNLYTEKLSHAKAFTQRCFHTEKSLHREAFTCRSFYTQKLLYGEVFTRRRFYTKWKVEIGSNSFGKTFAGAFGNKPSPLAPRKKPQFHDSMNTVCSNKHKEYISEAAGPHSIAFKPTLRWHRGSSNPAEPAMSVSSKIFCLVNANPLLWALTSTHYCLQKLDYDIFSCIVDPVIYRTIWNNVQSSHGRMGKVVQTRTIWNMFKASSETMRWSGMFWQHHSNSARSHPAQILHADAHALQQNFETSFFTSFKLLQQTEDNCMELRQSACTWV